MSMCLECGNTLYNCICGACPCEEKSQPQEQGEWISVEDGGYPEYYKPVWGFYGDGVELCRLVGRSYTPARKIWRNMEINNHESWPVTHWAPCDKPPPPTK